MHMCFCVKSQGGKAAEKVRTTGWFTPLLSLHALPTRPERYLPFSWQRDRAQQFLAVLIEKKKRAAPGTGSEDKRG